MAIEGHFTQEQFCKASPNYINNLMNLNTVFDYNTVSGSGNAEVSNSTEKILSNLYAQKIRSFNTTAYVFNTPLVSIVQTTGVQYIQFQAYKSDPNANVTLTLSVYINNTLTADRTVTFEMRPSTGFIDDVWNVCYQSFLANQGDEVTLAWSYRSSEIDTILYLSDYKIESAIQGITIPSIYSETTYLKLKYTKIYDFVNTQTLTEDVEYNFLVSGITETNCGTEILNSTITPQRLNSFFEIQCNFLALVPTGTNIHLDSSLVINGIIYLGQTIYLNKTSGESQYGNIVFSLPVNSEFLINGGVVTLTARKADIEISRKSITVKEESNYN
jgi:hypothetical protein